MTPRLTAPTAPVFAADMDAVLARAEFFFDLEMAELRLTIPQAEPVEGVAKY